MHLGMDNKRFAVVGKPVAHSLSPQIHQYFAQQFACSLTYERIHVEAHDFESWVISFFASGGAGLNITLPYKQKAFAMASHTTARCRSAGAANVLLLQGDSLCADNTDGVGLVRDLAHHITLAQARILILGAGGAARGIIPPLLAATSHKITLANRSVEAINQLRQDFPQVDCCCLSEVSGGFDLVLNATSSSVNGEPLMLPEAALSTVPFCYDLSYQLDQVTPFVAYAKARGCPAVDGLGMLIEQAAESYYLWHGVRPNTGGLLELLSQSSVGYGRGASSCA